MVYSSRVMAAWRQPPKVSLDTSPSPHTTQPTTPTLPPLIKRRRSSSSSDDSSRSSCSSFSSSSSDWHSESPLPRRKAGLPSFERLEDGDILYLPATPIPSSSIIRKHPNQSEVENHLVVVLGKRRYHGKYIVSFRQFTTFHGISVEEKKPERQRGFFMLCDNDESMTTESTNPIARMALGLPLKKRSYINLSPNSLFEIEYEYLDSFHNTLRRPNAESVAFIKRAR
ncbi:unnamed protein product [Alternaria alternata]